MPADRAAITAAKGRLRPIIMTGCAMISGMIPMSLGVERGSEQNAPLGRAVIGGMAFSAFATLLALPAVFTLLLGNASGRSPSLDPDDPESAHYDPHPPSHDGHGRARHEAVPGASREGKVVRSGFSLNPSTRTLQAEIDIPNSDGHLHPGWYATVTIAIDRKQVWALPSNAIGYQGGQDYFVYLEVDGKPVRTPVIVGLSDDNYTEVLKKSVPNANTNAWPSFDGNERVLAGNLDVLGESQPAAPKTASR